MKCLVVILRERHVIEIYKVLMCGDRKFKAIYAKPIVSEIAKLIRDHGVKRLLIIEGGAPGVDTMVKRRAQKRNVHVAEIEALWNTRYRYAGPQRNAMMAALDPHEVIAFHENINESKGTAGMLELAEKLGIPNRLVVP